MCFALPSSDLSNLAFVFFLFSCSHARLSFPSFLSFFFYPSRRNRERPGEVGTKSAGGGGKEGLCYCYCYCYALDNSAVGIFFSCLVFVRRNSPSHHARRVKERKSIHKARKRKKKKTHHLFGKSNPQFAHPPNRFLCQTRRRAKTLQGNELNLLSFSSLPLPLLPLLRPLPLMLSLTFLPILPIPHSLPKARNLGSARFPLAVMLGLSTPVAGIEGSVVTCEGVGGLEAVGVGGGMV